MKIRKRCKVRGNALVNKMRAMAKDYNRFMKENFSDSSFTWEPNTVEDYALWRFNNLTPSYDESVQDEVTRPFANFKDGMTRVYRRFRRTNIYIFCYERPFVKIDHKWFTFLRDSPSVVFADDIREAMEIQYAGTLIRKLRFNLHSFQLEAINTIDRNRNGESYGNTQFMKDAAIRGSYINQDMISEQTLKRIHGQLGVPKSMIVAAKDELMSTEYFTRMQEFAKQNPLHLPRSAAKSDPSSALAESIKEMPEDSVLKVTVAKNRFPKEGERTFTYDMVDRLVGPSGDFHGE